MTRKELEKELELSSQVKNSDKYQEDLKLRQYIELRLIADALIDISKSLKVDIMNINYSGGKYTSRLADILHDIQINTEKKY